MTREEVIKWLKEHYDNNIYVGTKDYEAHRMAMEALNQQKEGRWIKVDDDVNKIHYKECSCCSVKISFNLPFLDYCPKCGAKMKVDE